MTVIGRRTLLKTSGVTLALPLLESMNVAYGAAGNPVPKRMVQICTSLGLHAPLLWPKTTGAKYELTPYLEPLKEHRREFTLFSGLQHEDQNGRQPHDSELTWLTSARKPGMSGFRNTISVDQVAATRLGDVTRFPSITLGTLNAQSQSYTSEGVMIPAETSPARLFARLFLDGRPEEIRAQEQLLADGRSILDKLGDDAARLRRRVSGEDNHLLNDYFESVRSLEKNISIAQGWLNQPKPKVSANQPADVVDNADIIGRVKLLMDLIPLIVQTDSTRVITVMIQDHYVVPKVAGVAGNHHHLSHHGQDGDKIEQLQKVETAIVECFGWLLSQMKARQENGSTLLDNTSVLFGSNLGNANAHDARNLPIFLAGGGFGHGRYVAEKDGTPLCNLFVSMLNSIGLDTEVFGQSTGTLSWS